MAYHRVAKSGPRVDRRVERLRRALPLPTYLMILHQAATTGYLPVLDESGKPIPQGDNVELMPPKERLQVLQYLVDKAMPNVRLEAEPEPDNPIEVIAEPGAMSSLQLAAILANRHTNAPPPVPA